MSMSLGPELRVRAPGSKLKTLVTIVAVLAVLHVARDIVMPFALAVLLTFALAWPVTQLERRGLPRGVSVALVVVLVLGVVAAGGWIVLHQMQSVLHELPKNRAALADKLGALYAHLRSFESFGDTLVPSAPPGGGAVAIAPSPVLPEPGTTPDRPLYTAPADGGRALLWQVPAALGSVLAPLGTAAMVLLFVVFMLVNREDLRNRFLRVISQGDLTRTTRAVTEAWRRTGRYLGRQAIVNCAFGLAMGLGLFLLGVPGWALWGLLCTLLRFLPYIGTMLAVSMPMAMAIATSDGWGLFWATAALFLAVEIVVNLLIEPWFYAEGAGVSPFAVLVAAALWTWLWGPMGLVLAMPLTVVVVVLGRSVPQLAYLDVLLGTDEVLTAKDRFYQRLMANDPDEATTIVEEVAATAPLPDVCETLLVPALAALERDHDAGKLTDAEYAAVCTNVREAFEELEDQGAAARPAVTAGGAASSAFAATQQNAPGTVVCLPVKSGATEVAAEILSRLLLRANAPARTFSANLTFAERLQLIDAAETVCIVSLPDTTLRLARATCKRIQARRPELRIVVLPWGADVDPAEWRHRALCSSTDGIARSFAELMLFAGRLRQDALAGGGRAPDAVAATVPSTAT
jgi:predicted PurR-regulated permease PerM